MYSISKGFEFHLKERHIMYYYTYYDSPIGLLRLVSDGENLTSLWMEKHRYPYPATEEFAESCSTLPIFDETQKWLTAYFAKKRPSANVLPLAPSGSPFRQEIWRLLCQIPYGQVTTYGELARQASANMGRKQMSAQAVGGAVGHNPISIIIPCHRVVGTNGSLTGFGGGMENKIWLLKHEGLDMTQFTVPTHGTAL